MTNEELYQTLREKFRALAEENDLLSGEVKVECKALSPEEAIGITQRKDFPILTGHDVMLQAEFEGGIGQAFTISPSLYAGTLEDVLALDILHDDHDRAIFTAALNAVMRRLGLCDRSIHCKNDGPEECSEKAMEYLREHYAVETKIAQIGYQPAMLEGLSKTFPNVRVLDLNPKMVGKTRFGIRVLHGKEDYQETVDWAELILCTSSTVCNGTVTDYLDIGKEVLFYGTSGAGAAALLGWKRLCFAD